MTWHCETHGEVIPQHNGTSYRCPCCTARLLWREVGRDALAAKLVESDRWCAKIADDATVPAGVRMEAGNLSRKAPEAAHARVKKLEREAIMRRVEDE